jgi:hypothetical protein
MPAAPIPPAFQQLRGRRFVFHPAIENVGANEWTYRRATWSEILVRNAVTGLDFWIPRRSFGSAYDSDYGVAVINLLEPLEFRDGVVRPRRCRVIHMPLPDPRAERPLLAENAPTQKASVVSITLDTRHETRAGRIAGGAIALGVIGCLAVAGYSLQGGDMHRRPIVTSLDQTYLGLGSHDTFETAMHSLGTPNSDHSVIVPDGHRLRLADYPDRGFRAVFLKNPDDADVYIGAVDEYGRVLQSVQMPSGGTSHSLLRFLESF